MASLRHKAASGRGGAENWSGLPTLEYWSCDQSTASLGNPAKGTTIKPVELVEAILAEISSIVRTPSQTIELSGWIHRKPIKVLLDSRCTGNYISDWETRSFNLIIQSEEGSEQLTLADWPKVQVEGYFSFWLRCGQYNNDVITWVFPNMHQQLILRIPWLKQETPYID